MLPVNVKKLYLLIFLERPECFNIIVIMKIDFQQSVDRHVLPVEFLERSECFEGIL